MDKNTKKMDKTANIILQYNNYELVYYMNKKVHSAGIIDHISLSGRPFGLRHFDLDFLAVTFGGEALFMMKNEGISSRVTPVSFVYIPAGQRHIYDPKIDSKWQNYWVLFDGRKARQSFRQLIPTPGITSIMDITKLSEYWRQLSQFILDDSDIGNEYSFCMLHNILLELRVQSVEFTKRQPSPAISEAISFMRNNLQNPELNFKHLANQNGICPDSLRKRFKRETGIALHQYFIQLKINAAKSMLSNLSYNISDLAEFLGFNDQYYFSRLFKKKTGIPPSKYRNNLISREKNDKHQS